MFNLRCCYRGGDLAESLIINNSLGLPTGAIVSKAPAPQAKGKAGGKGKR